MSVQKVSVNVGAKKRIRWRERETAVRGRDWTEVGDRTLYGRWR